jgi:hypothetical protein
MAEVAIPRQMFQEILRLIAELRPQPPRSAGGTGKAAKIGERQWDRLRYKY